MAGSTPITRLPEVSTAERRAAAWRERLDRWTPAALRSHGEEFDRTMTQRTKRMWLGDVVASLFVLLGAVAVYAGGRDNGHPSPELMVMFDAVFVPVSLVLLFWRRQYPFRIGVAIALFSCVAPSTGIAALIGLFAIAAYSRPTVGLIGIGIGLVTVPVASLIWPHASGNSSAWGNIAFGIILTLGVGAWGLFAGARRELLGSLRERANRAESEQQLRVDQARQAERTRIAREMHDVLAHRMSLLSVHAGALEYRPDASPEEVARAAGVIRATAHEALEELRTVIGVLRVGDSLAAADGAGTAAAADATARARGAGRSAGAAGDATAPQDATASQAPEPPQPTLSAVPHLIEEWRAAGARIDLDAGELDVDAVPPSIGRTAYRIVQEALTNAGKHAPTTRVHVSLDGRPGDSLRISVTNPLAIGTGQAAATGIPGTGLGLVGVRERTELAGGAFAAGVDSDLGRFVLEARLPWAK